MKHNHHTPGEPRRKGVLEELQPPIPLAERLAWSVSELAQLTGLGRTTLYLLMGEGGEGGGKLAYFKVGKRRCISAEAWKACQEQLSTKEAK